MASFVVLPAARSDLRRIVDYIARDNPNAASEFVERLYEKFSTLAEFPFMGSERAELGDDIRSLPIGAYLIFYRSAKDGIEIVRVLHGAMDVPNHFRRS